MGSTLRKVAEVELDGSKFDLARNGEHYHLVETRLDDYEQPRARRIELHEFLFGALAGDHVTRVAAAKAQAVLDVLGETVERVKSHELARERSIGGMQGVTT